MWLLEELKVDYEVITYDRVNQLAPPELKKIHPLGKSPVISVQIPGQAKPLVLAESGFITEYLVEHLGPHLQPERYEGGNEGKFGGESESWMRYRYFLHYAEGSIMPFLVMKLVTMSKLVDDRASMEIAHSHARHSNAGAIHSEANYQQSCRWRRRLRTPKH